ncbi:hypothetical protein OB13_13285 [Pontibacter sp. HJ8]
MKQLFLLAILLISITTSALAQDITVPQTTAAVASDAIQEGNWMVGANIGTLGYNFKTETFTLAFEPRAGYFISDNAAIGAQAQVGVQFFDGGENFNYGFVPFVRYYFPEGAAPTHRWFGEGVAGFAGSSLKDSDGDRIFSSVLGLRAGYAHFVASHVALEGTLNYTRTSSDILIGSATSGLSLGLAFQIYLPGRANR